MSGTRGRVLIIQIPCYNEEASLPATLSDLPRRMPGFERVEWLVIDDGSSDRTAQVARRHGVDHVVELRPHQGLARAFAAGLERALAVGADVIVNTDADNQYRAADIPRLVAPILAGQADIVVGDRAAGDLEHFSRIKRLLQRIGSGVVRAASGTDVPDAPSGFRAMSREAALRTNVFGAYTYTLETIIQAGVRGLAVAHVPVAARPSRRPSRLYRSTLGYVVRQAILIVQVFAIYRPMRFFTLLGSLPFTAGFLLGVRWLILFAGGTPRSHVPSLILGAILMLMGFGLWMLGFIAELQSVNRRILEEVQLDARRRRFAGKAPGATRDSGALGSSAAAE
jgi:glycosyltransferase involved in cell wall biosynthesis